MLDLEEILCFRERERESVSSVCLCVREKRGESEDKQ